MQDLRDVRGQPIDTHARELQMPAITTDADLQWVASNCKQLLSLNLFDCDNITDAGLQAVIDGLPQLQSLELTACITITDNGLAHISRLQHLRTLCLKHCREVTDDGLAHIARLQHLQTMDIEFCSKTSDAGMWHLVSMPQLRALGSLRGTAVTRECEAALRAAFARANAAAALLADRTALREHAAQLAAELRASAEGRAADQAELVALRENSIAVRVELIALRAANAQLDDALATLRHATTQQQQALEQEKARLTAALRATEQQLQEQQQASSQLREESTRLKQSVAAGRVAHAEQLARLRAEMLGDDWETVASRVLRKVRAERGVDASELMLLPPDEIKDVVLPALPADPTRLDHNVRCVLHFLKFLLTLRNDGDRAAALAARAASIVRIESAESKQRAELSARADELLAHSNPSSFTNRKSVAREHARKAGVTLRDVTDPIALTLWGSERGAPSASQRPPTFGADGTVDASVITAIQGAARSSSKESIDALQQRVAEAKGWSADKVARLRAISEALASHYLVALTCDNSKPSDNLTALDPLALLKWQIALRLEDDESSLLPSFDEYAAMDARGQEHVRAMLRIKVAQALGSTVAAGPSPVAPAPTTGAAAAASCATSARRQTELVDPLDVVICGPVTRGSYIFTCEVPAEIVTHVKKHLGAGVIDEAEFVLKRLEQKGVHAKNAHLQAFVQTFNLNDDAFDPRGDITFATAGGEKQQRGGMPYLQPGKGWVRAGLQVLGIYDDGDKWLNMDDTHDNGCWAVAFHGTKSCTTAFKAIANTHFIAPAFVNAYGGSLGRRPLTGAKESIPNPGIYFAQDIEKCYKMKTTIDVNGAQHTFEVAFQARIHPGHVWETENDQGYLVVDSPAYVRPYGICLKNTFKEVRL